MRPWTQSCASSRCPLSSSAATSAVAAAALLVGVVPRQSTCRRFHNSADAFATAVADIFTTTGQARVAAAKRATSTKLQSELNALLAVKSEIDERSERTPDTIARLTLAYLTLQTCTLYYWVYYRFDWCLCEPITYLLGTAVGFLGIGFYLITGGDYDWNNIRSLIMERSRRRQYAVEGLDVARIQVLQRELALLEKELQGAAEAAASPP